MRAVVLRDNRLEVLETDDLAAGPGVPAIGKSIGLDEVPDALEQLRNGQGPPRVVIHPTPSES